MRGLKTMKSMAMAVALCASASAWAATSFTFVNEGVALPALPPAPNACPPPPALPLNCDITALGKAETVSGDLFSPWKFSSVFQIGNAFAVTGTFLFDDPGPSNNDFFGTITGLFNPNTFSSVIDYVVTGGSGVFAGRHGLGSGVVQIIPSASGPPTYVERGQFSIPEPATAGLLAAAALLIGALRRGAARR